MPREHWGRAGSGAARPRLAGPPPLLMGEFSADDVLLWLQVTAFRSRPPLTGLPPQGSARQAHRQQIREEIRTLKRRSGAELAPRPAHGASANHSRLGAGH